MGLDFAVPAVRPYARPSRGSYPFEVYRRSTVGVGRSPLRYRAHENVTNKNSMWAPVRDQTILRRRQPYNELLPATVRWTTQLPAEVQPLALVRSYPRIANMIARSWSDNSDFELCIEDLLTDRRGNRRGFPVDVLQDLFKLRDYYHGRYPLTPSTGSES